MEPREAAAAVTDAKTEAEEARQLVDALADRVRDGDQDVTPEQLAGQKQLAEFARLRLDAAHRQHARAATEAREARAQRAADAGRDLLDADDTQPILDAARAALDALTTLVRVARERNDAIRAAGVQLDTANAELLQAGEPGPFPIRRFGVTGDANVVIVPGTGRTATVHPGHLVGAMAHLALTGDGWEQRNAREVVGGLDAGVQRIGEEVPGLAEAWRVTPEEWAAAPQDARAQIIEQGRRPAAP